MIKTQVKIRPLSDDHSIDAMTELLHRAYGDLARRGWHFLASHQDAEITLARCKKGDTFVAEADGELVGTITLATVANTSGSPWLERAPMLPASVNSLLIRDCRSLVLEAC